MKVISLVFFSFLSIFLSCNQQQGKVIKNNKGQNPTIAEYIKGEGLDKYAVATFAGGCFWCTEASFEQIKGVVAVISGYSGGEKAHPTYKAVSNGETKHTESIQIFYEEKTISFDQLLDIFFVAHDPTQLNRQGPDVGPHYRSAIFYHDASQKRAVDQKIKEHNQGAFKGNIVTQVVPYQEFWVAEAYHQDYYPSHQDNPYIKQVSRPKVEKVKKVFKELLKK